MLLPSAQLVGSSPLDLIDSQNISIRRSGDSSVSIADRLAYSKLWIPGFASPDSRSSFRFALASEFFDSQKISSVAFFRVISRSLPLCHRRVNDSVEKENRFDSDIIFSSSPTSEIPIHENRTENASPRFSESRKKKKLFTSNLLSR